MQRPDLRQIAGNIREALADCDRDTLLDMLTFVFKEYVVEGPPPLLINQAERVPDLEGLSFAELIRTLQTRLELPELNLFQVDGAQVLVRANGVLTPLDAGAARAQAMVQAAAPTPASPAPPPQQQQPPPRPVAGVQVVETTFTRVPARVSAPEPGATGAPPAAGQSPPPRRGLSVRGQPAGDDAPAPSARPSAPASSGRPSAPAGREAQPGPTQPTQPPQQSQQPAQQPAQQPPGEAPRDSGPRSERDIAAERFSLLELD
jgi:hypothetical protein